MALKPGASSPDSKQSTSRAWESLTPSLAEWMLQAMTSRYKQMTAVQASTIPLFFGNIDPVVEAVTGSGKTLAYVLPVVSKILRLEERTKKHHVAGIIVAPTRELVTQIHGVVQDLLRFHGPSAAAMRDLEEDAEGVEVEEPAYPASTPVVIPQLLVGGKTKVSQDLNFFLKRSPNLLIATPGRLIELLNSPNVHCPQSSFEVLVLDEADRLLDLGFKDVLQKIFTRLPKQRRTGLFSASVSEAVESLIRVGLRNPYTIKVKVRGVDGKVDRTTPTSLQMKYLITPASHKVPAVSRILSAETVPHKTIIYFSTCAAVDYFKLVLPSILPSPKQQCFRILTLHGKQPSEVRRKTLRSFTNELTPSILLATDVAARGLDIPEVDLVLQIDPPTDHKDFIHRCGRTARAGKEGLSILFLQPGHEEDYVGLLERRKTPITLLKDPVIKTTDEEAEQATRQIRRIVLSDLAIHEKAQRAFVSFVQAYSKHDLSSIFRINDLDWEDLGKAWGLLKLPKMPELRQWPGDKSLGVNLDWESYSYKDKKREQSRLQDLVDRKNGIAPPSKPNPVENKKKRAWSNKYEAREEREVRREKKHRKRDVQKWEQMTPSEREERRELEDMIKKVKAQNHSQQGPMDFEGFSD